MAEEIAYTYNEDTKEYKSAIVYEDEVPQNATTVEPPELEENQVAVFSEKKRSVGDKS